MHALRKKCPYSELFWSVFYRIWTEYGEAIIENIVSTVFLLCIFSLHDLILILFACGDMNLVKAYNTSKKFDIICTSKWYLDSSILSDSEQLNIEFVIINHPGNVRRGGVCAYFRETLPVSCISYPYLNV